MHYLSIAYKFINYMLKIVMSFIKNKDSSSLQLYIHEWSAFNISTTYDGKVVINYQRRKITMQLLF